MYLKVNRFALAIIATAAIGVSTSAQSGFPSEITYQGRLKMDGETFTETVDFQFRLWDDLFEGNQLGATQSLNGVQVHFGEFDVQMSFDSNYFNGEPRWIEISVAIPSGSSEFTTLFPRQPITATPYAIHTQGLLINSFTGRVALNSTHGNSATANRATVGGGESNTAAGLGSTIAGGSTNIAGSQYSTISGGRENTIGELSFDDTIGGGRGHLLPQFFGGRTIGGGIENTVEGGDATVGGGTQNVINALRGTIGGGGYNSITGDNAVIAGGGGFADGSPIGNSAGGRNATVPGGALNDAGGDYSLAAGRRAKAMHNGAFVWSDDTDSDFPSTADQQFLIRATGGVGINKNDPATALDVAGTVTADAFVGDGSGLINIPGSLWQSDGSDVSYPDGNVGIGTSTPMYKLHVAGGETLLDGLRLPGGFASDGEYVGTPGNYISFGHIGVSEDFIGYEDNIFYFKDSPGGSEVTEPSVVVGGNVGVGGTAASYPIHIHSGGTAVDSYPGASPDQKAHVQMYVNGSGTTGGGLAISDNGGFFDLNDGFITYMPLASGTGLKVQGTFRVTNNAWPDYVFEEGYDLRTLSEIEAHIQAHGHLPDVPTAAKIHAEGIDVSEMNAVLLRKIEEMTLHMIEMQKNTVQMQQEIDRLNSITVNQ
jgi:hypothetical protein